MSGWSIRSERPDEAAAIAALTAAAFHRAPHTDGTEATIAGRLRDAGALALSLVAEADGLLVGHVAFSPVAISDGTAGWYGLGPVSVLPSRQGEGIGSEVIREGLARLRQLGARGCVVLGEPAFYRRFGFEHEPQIAYPDPPPKYFQCVVWRGPAPRGEVSYASAFG